MKELLDGEVIFRQSSVGKAMMKWKWLEGEVKVRRN